MNERGGVRARTFCLTPGRDARVSVYNGVRSIFWQIGSSVSGSKEAVNNVLMEGGGEREMLPWPS